MKNLIVKTSTRPNGTLRVQTINKEPSMTQQQFGAECDINNIMAKYQKTGEFTNQTFRQGTYADFSEITDYHTMVNTVKYADEAFLLLPAPVRARFSNDPGQLLSFLQDDKNYDEALKLGLLKPKDLPKNTLPQNDAIQRDDQPVKQKTKSKSHPTEPNSES